MSPESVLLCTANLRLDLANEQLWRDGEQVPLRPKPFLLLRELMRHPRQLVSKQQLIEAGWGDMPVSDAVLTTTIGEIRRALGDSARKPYAIENIHGRGYRFLLEVGVETVPVRALGATRQGQGTDGAEGATAPAVPARAGDAPLAPAATRSVAAARWRFVVAAALTLTVATAVFLWRAGEREPARGVVASPPGAPAGDAAEPVAANPRPDERSIAVLPLDDYSPDGGTGWFADGLAEEILNVLAQSPDLRVASRTSSSRYRGAAVDVREIADALGVAYLLEGSVRTAGNRLRITLQLIRAADGLHVFSESWNRPLSVESVFSVQQEVSAHVLRALNAALISPNGVAGIGMPDLDYETYSAYLNARELLGEREPEALVEALDLLQEVVANAPGYAPAHAALANAWLLAADYIGLSWEEAQKRAAGSIDTALAIAPDDGEAHSAAAFLAIVQDDLERGLRHANRAVSLTPSNAEAHYRRGVVLDRLGRVADMEEAFRRASLLDPLSPIRTYAVMTTDLQRGNMRAALEAARRSLKWNPRSSVAHAGLAHVLMQLGDYVQAYPLLQEAVERSPDQHWNHHFLGLLYWRLGMDEQLMASDEARYWLAQGAVLAARGDSQAAVARVLPYRQRFFLDLTPLSVMYWADAVQEAMENARYLVDARRLTNPEVPLGFRPEAYQAIVLLEPLGDPAVVALRERLDAHYERWDPQAELVSGVALYCSAAWRMIEGDRSGALAQLEAAARRGLVFRELTVDPLFDGLREDTRFTAVLAAMEDTARQARERIAVVAGPAVQQPAR